MNANRRLFVGGALAAAVGAGVFWWRPPRPAAHGATPPPLAAPAASDFWSQTFASLDGQALRTADWRGRPLLLNFWATWCAPCVTEMPMLDRFHATQPEGGMRTLALALDDAEKVRAFVATHHLRLPIAVAEGGGLALSKALGNDKGGLPYSIVFDRAGNVAHRKSGALAESDLAAWLAAVV